MTDQTSEKISLEEIAEELRKETIRAYEKGVQEAHERYEPYWKAKVEIGKTIVSLSSGALVLVITLGGPQIKGIDLQGFWGCFPTATWLLFLLSTISTVVSLWAALQFRKQRWEFEYDKRKIITKDEIEGLVDESIGKKDNEEDALAYIWNGINDKIGSKLPNPKCANTVNLWSLRIAMILFIGGLVTLAALGIKLLGG